MKPKRLSKEEKLLAEAARLASLLAEAPRIGEAELAPPAFIADKRLAAAAKVWEQLAPLLETSRRLQAVDRTAFAALCYWQSEFLTAVDDIAERGYSFLGKAIAGGSRPWTNPSVARRDTAWSQVVALSAKFGLTPLDRIALNKNKGNTLDDSDMLPGMGTPAPAAPPADGEAEVVDPWSRRLPN